MNRLPTLLLLCLSAACASVGTHTGKSMAFEVKNEYVIEPAAGGNQLRAWLAIPGDDELQDVTNLRVDVDAPGVDVAHRETRASDGNRMLYVEASGVGGKSIRVTTTFAITRRESRHDVDPARTRPMTEAERAEHARYLAPSTNIQLTPKIREAAANIIGTETNPVKQARKIYGWVLNHVSYWVKHPDRMKSSGIGSSEYCMTRQCGNCTDFHSLYAAVARAAGIPTRMVYGSFFKGPLNGKDQDQSYHCWIEFWAPELGWIPLDVAVADIFVDDFRLTEANKRGVELTVADGYKGPDQHMVDYYFGNLDARRVTWHRGRDLHLAPAAADEPINALPKAHVEVDGKPITTWTRKLTFVQKS